MWAKRITSVLLLLPFLATTVTSQINNPDSADLPPPSIVSSFNEVNEDGSYSFGYEASDGTFKTETKDIEGNVIGKYGFLDNSGELKIVAYTSNNKTGFTVSGDVPDLLAPSAITPPQPQAPAAIPTLPVPQAPAAIPTLPVPQPQVPAAIPNPTSPQALAVASPPQLPAASPIPAPPTAAQPLPTQPARIQQQQPLPTQPVPIQQQQPLPRQPAPVQQQLPQPQAIQLSPEQLALLAGEPDLTQEQLFHLQRQQFIIEQQAAHARAQQQQQQQPRFQARPPPQGKAESFQTNFQNPPQVRPQPVQQSQQQIPRQFQQQRQQQDPRQFQQPAQVRQQQPPQQFQQQAPARQQQQQQPQQSAALAPLELSADQKAFLARQKQQLDLVKNDIVRAREQGRGDQISLNGLFQQRKSLDLQKQEQQLLQQLQQVRQQQTQFPQQPPRSSPRQLQQGFAPEQFAQGFPQGFQHQQGVPPQFQQQQAQAAFSPAQQPRTSQIPRQSFQPRPINQQAAPRQQPIFNAAAFNPNASIRSQFNQPAATASS